MNVSTQIVRPTHAGIIDDEIAALTLQREEIIEREDTKKAKYTLANIPDVEVACANYLAEIERQLQLLRDVKIAHSIADAVDSDASAIAELVQAETQAEEDRQVAIQMNNGQSTLDTPPPDMEEASEGVIDDAVIQRIANMPSWADESDDEFETTVAGPSEPYARHQAHVLEKLVREDFQCTACADNFRWVDITHLQCEHDYCPPCLKRFILRGVTDHELALIPPRCCGQSVPHGVIVNVLNHEEMEDFQNATVERDTRDKTYCSNAECGKFIAPQHIVADDATCPKCKSRTCTMCKNAFHMDDCPEDPGLQATLELGTANDWQRCFSCRSLVAIERGCNHMTYVFHQCCYRRAS
jgi:hypothetical protein